MRIELDLPDWVEERHIRIFAGIEEVAKKMQGKPWQVKVVRCNYCGRCCMNVPDNWVCGKDPETGNCQYLTKEGSKYVCGIGRPFFCCAGDPSPEEYCSIEWKEV